MRGLQIAAAPRQEISLSEVAVNYGDRSSLQADLARSKLPVRPEPNIAPQSEVGPQRTLEPRTLTANSEWSGEGIEHVPQNTIGLAVSGENPRRLVTEQVYDCVAVAFWDPVTRRGGLAHIPQGSNTDLTDLAQTLQEEGLDPSAMQWSLVGGVDYAHAVLPGGRLVPSGALLAQRIEQQLVQMGVAPEAIKYDTVHTREEIAQGRSSVGLDLSTGEVFVYTDPDGVVPAARDRGYSQLQDPVTDLYRVGESPR